MHTSMMQEHQGVVVSLHTGYAGTMVHKPHILMITADFSGLTHNGGIGSAFRHLADFLVSQGMQVSVLYTNSLWTDAPHGDAQRIIQDLAQHGITIIPLPEQIPEISTQKLSPVIDRALRVYHTASRILAEQAVDVVHLPDWLGEGYFLLHAKCTQNAFTPTHFCVQAHSTSIWHRLNNGEALDTPEHQQRAQMERASIALADSIISPSRYMLDWYQQQGWDVPQNTQVIGNLLPVLPTVPHTATHISELVFFGRLEHRKGLALFCETLQQIQSQLPTDLRITFLGKNSIINGAPSSEFLDHTMADFPRPWQWLGALDSTQAQQYLAQPGRLAVIPALLENAPYVVLECLHRGIPFIATDSGGTAELIAEENIPRILCAPTIEGLSQHLLNALAAAITPARPAQSMADVQHQWATWHARFSGVGKTDIAPPWHQVFQSSPLLLLP